MSASGSFGQSFPGAALGIRKEFAMSKLQLEPQEKMDLLAYLDALLGRVNSLHASVGAVKADLAALRNTVFDDPEEIARYRANLRSAVSTARPIVDDATRLYDDLLQEIADSQQFPN
jgi:hypothetical protein